MLAVVFGGWSGVEGNGDWGKVPATVPVIIFSLVYHDLAPGKGVHPLMNRTCSCCEKLTLSMSYNI